MFSKYNICFVGGDRRSISTAEHLKNIGFNVSVLGLNSHGKFTEYNDLQKAIETNNIIILPLPITRDGVLVNTPLSNERYYLSDIIKYKPALILGGIIKGDLKETLKKNGIKYYDYYDSEYLTVKNAVLTAEAALSIAINETDKSIYDSNSVVIGYGRIGKQLAKYLKALGSKVTATSRSEGTLATIESDGIIPLLTENCQNACYNADYVFNTVPYPIFDDDFFEKCSEEMMFLDLATDSKINLSKAQLRHIKCGVYGGLPGKYSSITAGNYIAEEIIKYLNRINKEEPT